MAESKSDFFYYSRFLPTYDAGGGSRRLLQTLDLLSPLNFSLVSAMEAPPQSKDEKKPLLSWRTKEKSKLEFLSHWSSAHRAYIGRLWDTAKFWSENHVKAETRSAVVMDDPIYFLPLFDRLKKQRRPIVAICHNLESLSTSQTIGSHQMALLNEELNVLNQCDLVITISREETFLLQNMGINSTFFPYYPPEKVCNRLVKIREQREQTSKKHLLMLGTANNIATKKGMLAFIEAWQKLGLGSDNRQLLVAGYGTDKLEGPEINGVSYLGPLPEDELDLLLQSVKGCVCYQEQAAGALTRIPEMLLAGIPIVANSHAARTYYNQPGVIEFSSLSSLEGALKRLELNDGKHIPQLLPPDVTALHEQLRALMTNEN